MSDSIKSIVSAVGVVSAIGFIILGTRLRDQVDGGVSRLPGHSVQSLVASRDDHEVPESDYFTALSQLVKREYVEPVTDDQKLADGAVRGMIASLGDPQSLFYEKDSFKTFLQMRQGEFQGIGVSLDLLTPGKTGPISRDGIMPQDGDPEVAASAPEIPRLTVTSVVPNGPADRAGVKVGDIVFSVDGHWVVSGELLGKFRVSQSKFEKKQITPAQFNEVRKQIHAMTQRALLPLRAMDRVVSGTSGKIAIVWERGGLQRPTEIEKAPSQMPPFESNGNQIRLPFVAGSAEKLRAAIASKTSVTIDLRNNALGDYTEMKSCLAAVAPSGQYGRIVNVHTPRGNAYLVTNGNSHPPKITLEVDASTRGAAEIFALALNAHANAKLEGTQTGGDRSVRQVVELPSGDGFTLLTGNFEVSNATTTRGAKTK